MTIFVGRNGAGKSNTLDSLRFTSDALNSTLEFAIRERGGIDNVRRRSLHARPNNFGIHLALKLGNSQATYAFTIAAVSGGKFRVSEELCEVRLDDGPKSSVHRLRTIGGALSEWSVRTAAPAVLDDRLTLVAASGTPEFRPVFDGLTRMAFHNLVPEAMKKPQKPEAGERLAYDGHNLASVIKHLQDTKSKALPRVIDYLGSIGVPIAQIAHRQIQSYDAVQFVQKPKPGTTWTFDASSMSDGTIRACGILVSLLSAQNGSGQGPTLVGIEEPEATLHPAASGALIDALLESATNTQIIVTCHSPDLLDHSNLEAEMFRVVVSEEGETRLGPLSAAKADLLRNHLSTAGELLRLDQLTPDPADLERQKDAKGTLWEAG